jgi:hypothetical protein
MPTAEGVTQHKNPQFKKNLSHDAQWVPARYHRKKNYAEQFGKQNACRCRHSVF